MSVMGGSSVAVSGGSTIANSTADEVRCSMTRSECVCVRVAVPMLWAAGSGVGGKFSLWCERRRLWAAECCGAGSMCMCVGAASDV
jgi:hypothetical protein